LEIEMTLSSNPALVKLDQIQLAHQELGAILARCPDATLAELSDLFAQARAKLDFAVGRVDSLRAALSSG
jgi:hypothetical protein